MAEIRVTTELCAEDRTRLDNLFYAIVQQTELLKGRQEMAEAVGKFVEAPAEEPQAPATAEEPEAPAEEIAPEEPEAPVANAEAPKIKLADIQQKVVALSAAGKRDEVRGIVKKYAECVSKIAEEAYVEVWDDLTALEG